ncbi:ARM REPEAT PROTEIN INTERACTING WITH abf2 [Orobanche hederae]
MSKEYDDVVEKDSSSNVSRFGVLLQRQQTLGEITLEEFLVRAGVVREEDESPAKPTNNLVFFTDLWQPSFATSNLGFEEFSNPVSLNLPLNVNGFSISNNNIFFLNLPPPRVSLKRESQVVVN